MVDFYGFHVGNYTSPMDPMAMNESMHVLQTSSIPPLKVDKISSRDPSLTALRLSQHRWTYVDIISKHAVCGKKHLNKQQIVFTSKVGSFSPTGLQNMRKSKWVNIFPNFWGETNIF